MIVREKYYLGADGVKYARYNILYNLHPHGTKMYCNIGNNRIQPQVYDLPSSAYPFTIIYENEKQIMQKW